MEHVLEVALQGHHFTFRGEMCEADGTFAFDQIATLDDQILYSSVHGDRIDTQCDVLGPDPLYHVTVRTTLLLYYRLERLSSELLIRFHLNFDSYLVRSNHGHSLRGLRPDRSQLAISLYVLLFFVGF